MKPTKNRLLVRPTDPDTVSKGGLTLKTIDETNQSSGTVVSVGEGDEVTPYSSGDFVIFFKYGPQEVVFDGKKYLSVHVDELIAYEPIEQVSGGFSLGQAAK